MKERNQGRKIDCEEREKALKMHKVHLKYYSKLKYNATWKNIRRKHIN